MGLFDVFGAGGGSAAIQIATQMVGAGSSLEGNVVFTGGKRAQQITAVTMRVSQSRTQMQMTKEGPRQHTESRDVVPQFQIAGATTSTPGQAQAFAFSINIPAGAPPSQPGHLTYSLHANVDIPGEVDAGASVPITIVQGAMGAQMAPPMGMGMGGMPPQPMGMPQMPPQPMGMPQMPPQPMGMPPQPGYPQMPPQQPMGMGMPQMPPQPGYPQMPPQPGYPQMPPQQPMGMGMPQMPPQMGMPPQPPMGYPQMPPPMGPPQMGSYVMAMHPMGKWAPGRVTAIQKGMYGVDWDDPNLGASTWVPADQVKPR